jgi:N-hydroxyarylamine O-acetyltransferase
MTPGIDLDAYFERIGWGGSTQATFDTLSDLVRAHVTAIPFQNLDVLLGRPIRLDLEGIQDKLVRARRGATASSTRPCLRRCSSVSAFNRFDTPRA